MNNAVCDVKGLSALIWFLHGGEFLAQIAEKMVNIQSSFLFELSH
jgi:hypothetical protein